jgi:hypothetical protein
LTTASYVDLEIPEELPENNFTFVGRIVAFGPQDPPSSRTSFSNNNRPQVHLVIEPLSYQNKSDMNYRGPSGNIVFTDENEHDWYPIFDKNGDYVKPDSKFGHLQAAFKKLGYGLTTTATFQALVGKVFIFEKKQFTTTFKKINPETNEPEDDPRNWYAYLPVKAGDDNYVHSGPRRVVERPMKKNGAAPSIATMTSNWDVARPKLAAALAGHSPDEYLLALVSTKDPDITCQPYSVEAAQDPDALTRRMVDAGMAFIDGRLVSA